MIKHCPTCRCQAHALDPVEVKLLELQKLCKTNGVQVSYDGSVSELSVAKLLNRQTKTIRNWRYADQPMLYRKIRGRVTYPLKEVAALLVREELSEE